MSDHQPAIVTPAKAPFDKSNADLILRSSDNVDFRVFKIWLSLASPVFDSMFTLPQPRSNEVRDTKGGLPVIPMSEPSSVVETLLRFCYPRWYEAPALNTLEEFPPVLEATIKYGMEGILNSVQEMLMAPRFVNDEVGHLRVFCIAVRYGLKEAAMVAMRHTRHYPLAGRPYIKELDHISARTYHQLSDYHWRCSTAVAPLATHSRPWIQKIIKIPECRPVEGTDIGYFKLLSRKPHWPEYVEEVGSALRERPCGATALGDLATKALHNDKCKCFSSSKMMREFTVEFAKEIEATALAVELKLDFEVYERKMGAAELGT